MQRPDTFTIDPYHHLAQGLVFAGLGAHAGGMHYHDSSRFGNDGTLTNMETSDWGSYGGVRYLEFDGGEYVSLGDRPQTRVTSALTISAWVKPTAHATQGVLSKYHTGSQRSFWLMLLTTDLLNFTISPDGVATSAVNSTGAVAYNDWSHIAVTWSAGNTNFYINGDLDSSPTTLHTSIHAGTASVDVGVRYNSNTGYFTGGIRDPILHRRALSIPEIQQLADPSNVMLSGLILPPTRRWWPVSSGGGATVAVTLGTVTITGNACSISAGTSITCTAGSLGVSPSAVTVSAGTTVNATAGNVTVTGNNCSISAGTSVSATLGTVTVTGLNATISTGATIDATLGTVAVTANNCSISAATTLSATAGTVTITSYAASVSAGTTVACSLGQIVAAALNATVTATTSSTISCTKGTVTLASYAATLSTGIAAKGVHYSAGDNRPHYSAADNRPHYSAGDNRPHYTSG